MSSSSTIYFRVIITAAVIFSTCAICNGRKQQVSGSHPVIQDEPLASTSEFNKNEKKYRVLGISEGHLVLSCLTKNLTEVKGWGIQSCAKDCSNDTDCLGEGAEFRCICDGPCGLTCNKPREEKGYCGLVRIENGRVLVVGELGGLYDYRNQLKRFRHNAKITFECELGFVLSPGPVEKTCRNGFWLPADNPKCIEVEGPSFRWIRSARTKRRAKNAGGTLARIKGAGAVGDRGQGRRINRKNPKRPGEEDDFYMGPISCPSLDHDEFMNVEVIRNGLDENNTYSVGAVAKISCTPGFGVNLNNQTVSCEKGKWRPKLPQCSALPCRVPYIIHGTFYVGRKPLFFQELKPHDVTVELRCSKGFMVSGPKRLHCYYGEWNVNEAPECVPAACKLPHLEKGMYLQNYKADMVIHTGVDVDYVCDENYQKPYQTRSVKCDHGSWEPTPPKCLLTSLFSQRNFSLENYIPPTRKACGTPPQEKLAISYMEGIPLDFKNTDYRIPHGNEIMYRCVIIRPGEKNRWKITCDDGKWVTSANNITCEGNITASDYREANAGTPMINSSCIYKRTDKHVSTFYNDQEIKEEELEFPFSTVLISRCVDIGKFELKGARRRKCISGQWLGLTPKCEGLSQYHDYATDKSPTILFRFVNGSIAQTVDGKLIVYPGTTIHMECLYLRKFGRPSWEVSNAHRSYAEGWTDNIDNRDPTLEYRLTIDNASERDSGIYSCSTPTRHSHQIHVIVKKINCPPLPVRDDLIYSTDSTIAGTRVKFTCKENQSLIGNEEVQCQASGTWTGGLPRCENVECPDISMVPAMAPLAYTEITRNGTLKKNETAPPKIKIQSRGVGGKVTFSCPQGFMLEGKSEASCLNTGEWSDAIPLCKEVECPKPPMPTNGYVSGQGPFKAGDFAQIECNQGFMMEGRPIIACQDTGKWSRASTTTRCVPACTYPGTTIGGTISLVKFYYAIGEVVQYECAEGYQLVGEKVLHCGKAAKWSHPIPNCVPKMSGDSPGYHGLADSRGQAAHGVY